TITSVEAVFTPSNGLPGLLLKLGPPKPEPRVVRKFVSLAAAVEMIPPEPFQYPLPALKPSLSWLVTLARLPPWTIMSFPLRSSRPAQVFVPPANARIGVTKTVRVPCDGAAAIVTLPVLAMFNVPSLRARIPPPVFAPKLTVPLALSTFADETALLPLALRTALAATVTVALPPMDPPPVIVSVP